MAMSYQIRNSGVFFFLCVLLFGVSALGRPATFLQDFHVTWSDSHIKQLDQGRAIQLRLDQSSGNITT